MLKLKAIVTIWGLCDICSIGWFIGWRIVHAQIPFYYDINKSIQTNTLVGAPSLVLVAIFSQILHVSLIFSGVYLIKRRKAGAILSYIQTPFRFFLLIPPSIFFITWPLKYFFPNPGTITAFGTLAFLLLFSETLKLWSIIRWRKLSGKFNKYDDV
jgi:hypothetical protein